MTALAQRRGISPFVAAIGALAWSAAFAVWALVGSSRTTCEVTDGGPTTCSSRPLSNGHGTELLAVLVPAAVSLAVWALLRRYCTRGERAAQVAAAVLAGLFATACVLGMFTIGLFLAPAAIFLVLAVTMTEPPPAV